MHLRYLFRTLRDRLILAGAAPVLLALAGGCQSSPTAPSLMANVAGTWVSQSTTMVLEQNGSIVTGTWSRIAESQTTNGVVSGNVSRDQFTIRAELVTRYSDSSNPCATVTTVVGGVLTVSEDSMSGVLTDVRQPPCILRPAPSQSTWRRVAS